MNSLKTALQTFFQWWGEGLLQGLPDSLRGWFQVELPRLLLRPLDNTSDPERFEATWVQDGKSRHLGELSLAEGKDFTELLPKRMRKKKFITELQLDTQHVLSLHKSFPESLKANLVQSVGYQIDRITPFSADKVYFTAVAGKHDKKTKQIATEILVSPKRHVDNLLAKLGDLGAKSVQRISVAGKETPVNLAPASFSAGFEQSRFSKWPLYFMLAALIISLLAPVAYKQRRLAQIETAIGDVRTSAAEQLEIRDKLFAAEEALTFLKHKRETSPMALEVVETLSREIPADTWLQRVELKGQTLEIRGESDQALALIDLLEESDEFSDVRFNSPVSLNKKTKKDKFHIQATVEVSDHG
jgi:general secretion pathway protein L